MAAFLPLLSAPPFTRATQAADATCRWRPVTVNRCSRKVDVDQVFDTVQTLFGNKEDEYAAAWRLVAARDEQESLGFLGQSFITYGEYDLELFTRLLAAANPQPGETFYDLGSGVGRLVIAASLLYPDWRACKGVELLPAMHQKGEMFLERFYSELPENFPRPNVELSCGDFNEADLSDADVVFCYSTTWPSVRNTLTEVSRKLGDDMKFGGRVITADRTLAEITSDGVGFEKITSIEGINNDTGDSCGYVWQKVVR